MPVAVELFDDLDAVAADAAGALDRAAQPSLFDRLDWFRLTAAHCPPRGKLLVARGREGERSCWLFLAIENKSAQVLGSWYSLRAGPVDYPPQPSIDLLTAICAALRRARPRISSITVGPVGDPAPLLAGLRGGGWWASATPMTVNWQVETEGLDWAVFWAARPSTLRNTWRRKAKAAGLAITIHRAFDPEAWAEYEAIYRESWKPAEGSPGFLRALAEQEGAAGALRLGIARQDGRAIAAQFWLVENGIATIHKLAHVEGSRALSPGTILSEAMFRHVIEQDRPRLIDFGTGDEPYKADWMDRRATLWRVDAHDPARPIGLVRGVRMLVRDRARR